MTDLERRVFEHARVTRQMSMLASSLLIHDAAMGRIPEDERLFSNEGFAEFVGRLLMRNMHEAVARNEMHKPEAYTALHDRAVALFGSDEGKQFLLDILLGTITVREQDALLQLESVADEQVA